LDGVFLDADVALDVALDVDWNGVEIEIGNRQEVQEEEEEYVY